MPVNDLLARGEQLAREAQEEEKELLRQRADYLANIDEQIRRLRSFIRIIAPTTKKSAGKRGGAAKKTVAREQLVQIAEACLAIADKKETFSVADVAKAVQVHATTVRLAMNELRDREFVRRVPGRSSDRRIHFAVLDAHVLDQIIATSENGHGPTKSTS